MRSQAAVMVRLTVRVVCLSVCPCARLRVCNVGVLRLNAETDRIGFWRDDDVVIAGTLSLFTRRLRSVDLNGFLIGTVMFNFTRSYCCFRLL